MLDGIDVSSHNGPFSTDGQSFVIIRASYGTGRDMAFGRHFARARAAGVVTGAYCFGRNQDPAAQADRLIEIGGEADLLVLDRESDAGHPTMTVHQARAFIARIHERGRRVGLYASESGYPADAFGADWRWVANYSREPRVPWDIWQWTGTLIDRNRFRGTLADLHMLAGREFPPPATGQPPDSEANPVKFLQLSSADLTALPSIEVPADTPLEDFAGEQWDTIGPTKVRVLPGLVDAHTNRRIVVVSTGRFYADRKARPTAQVAVLR